MDKLVSKIITIGLSPAWDRIIEVRNINWNQHKTVLLSKRVLAGKAFNINKALAQLGRKSIAAGLWGEADWKEMKQTASKAAWKGLIQIKFTRVTAKRTRENITIVDTAKKRSMHLRSESELADEKALSDLNKDLQRIVTEDSICIFSGALPEGKELDEVIRIIDAVKRKGARVVVDTSGQPLKKIVSKGGLFIIKPNFEEFCELIGKRIPNRKDAIVAAAKRFLDRVDFLLVSRMERGAILVGKNDVVSLHYTGKKYHVYNTVGCGDFLLAGFISEFLKTKSPAKALREGIKLATLRAFGRLSVY